MESINTLPTTSCIQIPSLAVALQQQTRGFKVCKHLYKYRYSVCNFSPPVPPIGQGCSQQVSDGEMNGVGGSRAVMCMIGQGEVLSVILGPPDGTVAIARVWPPVCNWKHGRILWMHRIICQLTLFKEREQQGHTGQERRLRFFRSLTHPAFTFSYICRSWLKGFLFLLADASAQSWTAPGETWLWLTQLIFVWY